MKKIVLLKSMLLLFALIAGSVNMWGTEKTIEITYSNFENTSYNTSENTFVQSDVTFGYLNAMKNGSNNTPSGWAKNQVIQTKSGSCIYNKGAISGLKNIRVYIVANTNAFTITSGSTTNPTTNSVQRPTTATGTESITYSSYSSSGKTVTENQSTTATYYDFPVSNDFFKITSNASVYIWKVVLTYEVNGNQVAIPKITIPDGAFVSKKTVTITCETEGAAITYSTDGENWNTYSAPFEINETTTVQAKATKEGMTDSSVASATFTKETVLDGIAALNNATTSTETTRYVKLTNAQVTWAGTQSGKAIAYLNDATAGIYIYGVSFTKNTKYNGVYSIKTKTFNSLPEITGFTVIDGEGESEVASDMEPVEMTPAVLEANFTDNLARQIKIVGFTVPTGKALTDNITLYGTTPYTDVTEGTTYTLVGYPYIYNTNKTFRVVSATEVELADNQISGLNDTYTIDLTNSEMDITFSATATSGATVQYEVVSSTVPTGEYELNGNELTVTHNGVVVIRAYVSADATYKGAEKQVTVNVVDNPVIVVADSHVSYGSTFTVDNSVIEGGNITVTSGNTAIATVAGLTITPVAVGVVTITVETAATDIYKAGSETFKLTVDPPVGSATAKTAGNVVLFHETFGDNSGSARDWKDEYSVKSGVSEVYSGISSYTVSNVKQGKNTTGSTASGLNQSTQGTDASVIIGPLNVANYKDMTLAYQWKAASIKGTYSTSASYATSSDGEYTALTLNDGTGVGATTFVECAYSLPEAAQVSTLYLKIVWNTSNTQAIIDEVELSTVESTDIPVKLNSAGYATYCSQYPLDFTNAEDYSAWELTDIGSANKMVFTKITGAIKGGQGILLKGTAGAELNLTSSDSETELGDNMFDGTLAPTYIAAGSYYGLVGSEFRKAAAGTVPAGKAIIGHEWIDESVQAVSQFVFVDGTTGITTIEEVSKEQFDAIFDLQGRRLAQPQRGVNIINGKKVVIK